MEQEEHADHGHHKQLLDQLFTQVVHRPLDQSRTVVHGHHLDPVGQARLQVGQPRLYAIDGSPGILTGTHDHDAPDHFALAIQFRYAATHLRAQVDLGHVPQQQRRALLVQPQGYRGQIVHVLQVAGSPHHVLRLGHLHHRSPHFLVAALDCGLDVGQGNAEGAQFFRAHHHLVLLDHAPEWRHLGHSRHRLQLVLEEPVLQAAQLTQVVLATAVDQGIEIDPAHPRGIGAQLRPGAGGQVRGHLGQVLQYPGAGPVGIRIVVENHVDIGIPEEGIAAHGDGPGHRQHRRGQGIGHLVLHHLGCLPGVAGLDDDLDVREIGNRVHRRVLHRPGAHPRQDQGGEQDKEAVVNGPANQSFDHCPAPPA